MAHDVFVSHSVKDRVVAETIVAGLEAESLRCWVAPRDIVPGADWGESIIDAIESSRIMVLVFSANANASSQIKREIERAVDKEIYTIPFRIDNTEPTRSLEYFISTSQWIDAFPPPLEKHLQKLSQTVKAILAKTAAVPAEPVQAAEQVRPEPISEAPRLTSSLAWWKPAAALAGVLLIGAFVWFLSTRNLQTASQTPPSDAVAAHPAPDSSSNDGGPASRPRINAMAEPMNAPNQMAPNESVPKNSASEGKAGSDAVDEESPEDVARRFYDLINRGELRQAYDCLFSGFQAYRKWDQFKKDFADTKSIEVRELGEKSREASMVTMTVFYVATNNDGQTHEGYIELLLAREYGDKRPWRVFSHYL